MCCMIVLQPYCFIIRVNLASGINFSFIVLSVGGTKHVTDAKYNYQICEFFFEVPSEFFRLAALDFTELDG